MGSVMNLPMKGKRTMHVEQDTEAHDVDETSPLFPKRNAHPQQVDVLLIAPPMCDSARWRIQPGATQRRTS